MRPALPLLAACLATPLSACSQDPLPPDPVAAPAHCVQPEDRRNHIVEVGGTIVDFTTGSPVANAKVDITTAWDAAGTIPAEDCPLLATAVTDERGRFGPFLVYAGSEWTLPIMLFEVEGGGRALTLSDNRACKSANEDTCHLDHTIAAPSAALAAQWRAELASGGMADADQRGLIAFEYENSDGTPAAGVQPTEDGIGNLFLHPGVAVRFVDAGRAALLPAAEPATGSAGVALIGLEWHSAATRGPARIGGARGAEQWAFTGSLVVPGAIFVEDKIVSPPQ